MRQRDMRQQIMREVEKLFTTRRFHEITLDEVARAAQVGKGTIYRYFQNKDDLFFQTATSGLDDLCELLRRKVPEKASFFDQLVSACAQISSFFDARRQLLRMMQAEDNRMYWNKGTVRKRWMTHRKKLLSAVAEIITKGVAEGEIRHDIPAEVLASFLLGMLRTRARDLLEVPEATQRHELLVDLFCRGAGQSDDFAGRYKKKRRNDTINAPRVGLLQGS
jgi:AcrR family transcriptional regulator